MQIIIPNVEPLKHGEMAYFLKEYDDFKGGVLMRMQSLAVVRNDKLVEFPRILGPAANFSDVNDIFIFGGFAETCDALMDYASALREDKGLDEILAEQEATSTLLEDYANSIDMKRHLSKTHGRTLRGLQAHRSQL